MLAFQGVFWTVGLILVVYFAIRRGRIRKQETFERRDN